MERYHILLGMPGPNIRFQLSQSAYCCVGKGHQLEIVGADQASWDNMNVLWCNALNAARTQGVTHFAMIHADITPALDQDWINILLAEMQARDADFISAVVPIKDSRGITSCGIGNPQDQWIPHRRFTMHEIQLLPPTFELQDIGYSAERFYLNHNSGMILADLRKPVFWQRKPDGEMAVWFEFRKRMFFAEGGEAKLVGESEDWNISRRLWEAGARTCITRKAALKHYGMTGYPNMHAWGEWQHDEACRDRWQQDDPLANLTSKRAAVATAKKQEPRGWLFEGEQEELIRLATGKTVLEIGSYAGLSTVAMAQVANRVFAVDDFRGVPFKASADSAGQTSHACDADSLREEFFHNLEAWGVRDKVVVTVAPIDALLTSKALPQAEFCFYDADHSYDSTYSNGRQLMEWLGLNCTLAFHDYNAADPDVIRAVDQLAKDFGRGFRRVNTLAIFDGVA